jgi:hypothetical protein
MKRLEDDIVSEFQNAMALHAAFPRYPLRRRLRAAWWRFTDNYTAIHGVVSLEEVNDALFARVGSVWVPYQ